MVQHSKNKSRDTLPGMQLKLEPHTLKDLRAKLDEYEKTSPALSAREGHGTVLQALLLSHAEALISAAEELQANKLRQHTSTEQY
jgi:hypothetical protein